MKMRAKFVVQKIDTPWLLAERLTLSAVTDAPFDGDGNSEDNTYSKWTPDGTLKITVTNPALVGTFKEGEKYYLDFTLATA